MRCGGCVQCGSLRRGGAGWDGVDVLERVMCAWGCIEGIFFWNKVFGSHEPVVVVLDLTASSLQPSGMSARISSRGRL